jgi:hypothetical protein
MTQNHNWIQILDLDEPEFDSNIALLNQWLKLSGIELKDDAIPFWVTVEESFGKLRLMVIYLSMRFIDIFFTV